MADRQSVSGRKIDYDRSVSSTIICGRDKGEDWVVGSDCLLSGSPLLYHLAHPIFCPAWRRCWIVPVCTPSLRMKTRATLSSPAKVAVRSWKR